MTTPKILAKSLPLLGLALICLSLTAATTSLNVFEGESVSLEEANSTLEWGKNYSFNAYGINPAGETLTIIRSEEMKQNSISVISTSSETVNSTLWRYNVNQTPDEADTVVKISSSSTSGSTVYYNFTNLPQFDGKYQLNLDGIKYKDFNSGKVNISWKYDQWSKDHNFSLVTVKNFNSEPEDEKSEQSSSISGSSFSSSDEPPENPSNSRIWFKQQSSFSLRPEDVEGISELKVNTSSNQSQFEMRVERLNVKPESIPATSSVYSYYDIEVSAKDQDIEQSSIIFNVNESFAKSHEVVLRRFKNNKWISLEHGLIAKEDGIWKYKASTTGFSYYAIAGVKTPDQEPQANETSPPEKTAQDVESNESRKNRDDALRARNSSQNADQEMSLEDISTAAIKKSNKHQTKIIVSFLALSLTILFSYCFYGKSNRINE